LKLFENFELSIFLFFFYIDTPLISMGKLVYSGRVSIRRVTLLTTP
jgi:hypothetical protein